MTNTLSRVVCACALIALALLPLTARAGDWQPLAIGSRWEYRGTGGKHQVQTITVNKTVRGRVVAVKSYAEGVDAGLENYWLHYSDGSVLLAGFSNPSAGIALAYEPPLLFLPVPPAVGNPVDPQYVSAYDLLTDAFLFAVQIQNSVTEHVVLNLPAGSFNTFGVIAAAPPLPGPALTAWPALTLDGHVLTGSRPSTEPALTTRVPIPGVQLGGFNNPEGQSYWYSEDVGVVQYTSDDLYQLVSFGQPTPTVSATWGAIKRRFR
jgi:hypothetical protein